MTELSYTRLRFCGRMGPRPIPGSTEKSSRLAFELELNSAEGEYLTSRLTSGSGAFASAAWASIWRSQSPSPGEAERIGEVK